MPSSCQEYCKTRWCLLDELKADAQWKVSGSQIELGLSNVLVSNADIQGELKAAWRTGDAAAGARWPGVLDLQGTLARVEGTRVYRYLPISIPQFTRDYLQEAIVAGSASGVKLRIRGDLRDAPFQDPRRGEFLISGKVSNASFAYAPRAAAREGLNFPPLQQLSGELVIDRNTLEVRNAVGRIAGAPLGCKLSKRRRASPTLAVAPRCRSVPLQKAHWPKCWPS